MTAPLDGAGLDALQALLSGICVDGVPACLAPDDARLALEDLLRLRRAERGEADLLLLARVARSDAELVELLRGRRGAKRGAA